MSVPLMEGQEGWISSSHSPSLISEDLTISTEETPKRSLKKLAKSASIDSNGEIYFARSNSSASVESRRLSRSNSSFECSLREGRVSMGYLSLHSEEDSLDEEASKDAAPVAPVNAAQRRKRFGQKRKKLPQPNAKVMPVRPIQEGTKDISDGIIMHEGVFLQDLKHEYLFNDESDNNDNNETDSKINLDSSWSLLQEPTFTPVQPKDVYRESNIGKKAERKTDKRKFSPILPQNLNNVLEACVDETHKGTKQEMIVSDMPAFPYVRTIPTTSSYLESISSTMVFSNIQGIQMYLKNGQKRVFESESFDITFNTTKQLCYKGKLTVIISLKHLSIGFSLLKGKYDKELPWPFNMMVSFKLVNADYKKSTIRGFRSDINGQKFPQCLSRPSKCNVGIGFSSFISTISLRENGFTESDSLEIITRITPKEYVPFSEFQLELPTIVKT